MRLHISPCPNDTFIFHALLHGLVDSEGLQFEVEFEDIDKLNQRSQGEDVDIVKISYATLPLVRERYNLLECGGALGFGNAPIVVGKRGDIELKNATIAIPGRQTTAALLLKKLIDPSPDNLRVYLFSDIAEAVEKGEVDAGVLIHEGRFTYRERGLELVADLGEMWDSQFHLPVPLGAIVVSKNIDEDTLRKIERVVRRSVEYAMANPSASAGFVKCHAAELDDDVRQKHIDYFVNNYSVNLGDEGHRAIDALLGEE